LLINPSSHYNNWFEIFPDTGSQAFLQIFKNSIANGYPGEGINNGKHQYERTVSYFSRESMYIFQYYANISNGQSGGPLYIYYNNKFYVIGIITGMHKSSGLNFSVSYNQHHLNLYNYILNNGGQL
jgi:V8-like Glu-specific endopeptidase